ncbi:unnamed protein product [Phytophthora fragariaefolia]|uniref:Unnamed protein product n=1 Tax=Phytophthora fragariaefolia TaxID=1490495 RepID=A0A9W6XQ87_9STRA|nr:unnamed protein product [Phytophthora fragariaefolia]
MALEKIRRSSTTSTTLPGSLISRNEVSIPKLSTPRPSQILTRSLIEKIQEAKRLRQSEGPHDSHTDKRHNCRTQNPVAYTLSGMCRTAPIISTEVPLDPSGILMKVQGATATMTSIAISRNAPPIPHAKPIMPVIPLAPSMPPTVDMPDHVKPQELPTKLVKKTSSSVSEAIQVTNAVLLIQQTWRKKKYIFRSRRRNTDSWDEFNSKDTMQVALVVDKDPGNEVLTPLFSAVAMKSQKLQENDIYCLNDHCDTIGENLDGEKRFPGEIESNRTAHPWIDHELVFLEEGRCIGELQDSVRNGTFMNEDEVIWKRPQHVIQQVEAARIALLKKTRRKRTTSPLPENLADSELVDVPQPIVPELISPAFKPSQHVFPRYRGDYPKFTSRKRKMPRVTFLKRRSCNKVAAISTAKRSSRRRGLCLPAKQCHRKRSNAALTILINTETEDGATWESPEEEQHVGETESHPELRDRSEKQTTSTSAAIDLLQSLEEPSTIENAEPKTLSRSEAVKQFVVFSSFSDESRRIEHDRSRNDLISVGDLALARSLLYNRQHCQISSNLTEDSESLIPLTLPSSSPPPSNHNTEAWNAAEPKQPTEMTTGWSDCGSANEKDSCVCDNNVGADDVDAKTFSGIQPSARFKEDVEEAPEHHESLWSWDDLLPRREGHHDGGASLALSSATTTSAQAIDDSPEARSHPCSQRNADPLHALEVVKTAMTVTTAQNRSAHRDEQPPACNQRPPPRPSPNAVTIRPHLAEAQRLEFLRVLEDFKRCLSPPTVTGCDSDL